YENMNDIFFWKNLRNCAGPPRSFLIVTYFSPPCKGRKVGMRDFLKIFPKNKNNHPIRRCP
ncbi:MAG: hypothetical protein Q4D38_09955, partial [Planctomycetia bacterium]|nr:hypothetical protein [Planctomycetia bacterium]